MRVRGRVGVRTSSAPPKAILRCCPVGSRAKTALQEVRVRVRVGVRVRVRVRVRGRGQGEG